MVASASSLATTGGERFRVELAADADAIRAAQALRYRVFGRELGARLKDVSNELDVDDFDPYCWHLLVRETRTGAVVGCTRLLSETHAARLGRFYSASEFELTPITQLPGRLLEVGRTCIAPEARQGAAIGVLWSGLAMFIQRQGIDYLFGCASMPLGAGDLQAAAIMNRLRRQALAPLHLRVRPRVPLRAGAIAEPVLDAPLPGLIRAYVRLGARVCGEPCRDPDFGVADVLMLLDIRDLNPAYARHFIDRATRP